MENHIRLGILSIIKNCRGGSTRRNVYLTMYILSRSLDIDFSYQNIYYTIYSKKVNDEFKQLLKSGSIEKYCGKNRSYGYKLTDKGLEELDNASLVYGNILKSFTEKFNKSCKSITLLPVSTVLDMYLRNVGFISRKKNYIVLSNIINHLRILGWYVTPFRLKRCLAFIRSFRLKYDTGITGKSKRGHKRLSEKETRRRLFSGNEYRNPKPRRENRWITKRINGNRFK